MWVTARVMRCVVLLVRAAIGLLLLLALVLLLARPATAAAGERQQLVAQVEQGDDIKAHRLHFEPHPRQHMRTGRSTLSATPSSWAAYQRRRMRSMTCSVTRW